MESSSDNQTKMTLNPVGIVKSEIKTPGLKANTNDIELQTKKDQLKEDHQIIQNNICELVVFPEFESLLDGIEDFSHILVLYWPHLIDPERRKLKKVHPMGRKDMPIKGIFSTCSPARPNPILVSAVELVERNRNILRVKGFEAVDNSPVIDIKPYSTSYYRVEDPIVPKWMAQISHEVETQK